MSKQIVGTRMESKDIQAIVGRYSLYKPKMVNPILQVLGIKRKNDNKTLEAVIVDETFVDKLDPVFTIDFDAFEAAKITPYGWWGDEGKRMVSAVKDIVKVLKTEEDKKNGREGKAKENPADYGFTEGRIFRGYDGFGWREGGALKVSRTTDKSYWTIPYRCHLNSQSILANPGLFTDAKISGNAYGHNIIIPLNEHNQQYFYWDTSREEKHNIKKHDKKVANGETNITDHNGRDMFTTLESQYYSNYYDMD